MLTPEGRVPILLAPVEAIRVGPIQPVGEPGDGSIPWQRIIRIQVLGGEIELTLMADEIEILSQIADQR